MALVGDQDHHGVTDTYECHCNQCRYAIDVATWEPWVLPTEEKLKEMNVFDSVVEKGLPYTLGSNPEFYNRAKNTHRGLPPVKQEPLEKITESHNPEHLAI